VRATMRNDPLTTDEMRSTCASPIGSAFVKNWVEQINLFDAVVTALLGLYMDRTARTENQAHIILKGLGKVK